MLDTAIEFLNQGWVGSVLGVAGIVIGVVITYWFTKRSERIARPTIAMDGFLLVGGRQPDVDGLEVKATFHGRDVTRLVRSKVWFWNAGNVTLEGTSIVSAEPLRLEIRLGEEFLSARVVQSTRAVVNGLRVEIPEDFPNTLSIHFDFLDAGDGALIECYHNSEFLNPSVKGIIKGIPKGVNELYFDIYTSGGGGLRHQDSNRILKFGTVAIVLAACLKLAGYLPIGWWPFFGIAMVLFLPALGMRAPYPDSLRLSAGARISEQQTEEGK